MRANRKDISKQNLTEEDRDSLITVCKRFQELQLNIPILSVFEGRESKIRENPFLAFRASSKSSLTLVTEAIATCNCRNESLFKLDSTHAELCNVEVDGPLYRRLVEFFKSLAQNAPTHIAIAFRKISMDDRMNLQLRAQSSISSFRETDSGVGLTPDTQSSESADSRTTSTSTNATSERVDYELVEEKSKRNSGVQLPFSHITTVCRNKDFFGQEHVLDQIDQEFFPRETTQDQAESSTDNTAIPRSFVLCGMGGIGKTEVAIEYLFSRRHKFDAVFWVYADTTQKLAAQFSTIASELGLKGTDSKLDEVAAREMVKLWLSDPTGHYLHEDPAKNTQLKWLLVFDNADNPDIMYDWLPTEGPGSMLVTTRYPYMKENTYRLPMGLDLSPLEPSVGAAMLCKFSGRTGEPDATEAGTRIVQRLGCLPLAIAQMSAIIRRKHLSLNEFEEYYNENPRNLHRQRIPGSLGNYKQTVWTTWAVEQLSPAALAVLKVLSVVDPDRVPEKVLTDGADKVSLENFPKTKSAYFEARTELIQTSLVARNMATSELRLHRLVQDVVRETMAEEDLRSIFAAAVVLLSSLWPYVSGTDPTRNQAWRYRIAEKYTTHIVRLENLFGDSIRFRSYDGTTDSGILFSSFGWYLYERNSYGLAIIFAELSTIILQAAIDSGNGNDREVAHWLGEDHDTLSLAKIMSGVGDGMDDIKTWIQILFENIRKYKLKEDTLALGMAYNILAVSYISKEEVDDAIKSWRLSYDTIKNVKDYPQFSETWPAVNLALVLIQEGRLAEAEELLVPVLDEHEDVLGMNDKTTVESGQIWRTMGNLRVAQERYDEGLRFHERAVENLRAVNGDKHEFTGDCLYAVAKDYLRREDFMKALSALEGALTTYTDDYHKPQAARALWKKGLLVKSMDNVIEGDALLARAMQLRHDLRPDDRRPVEDLTDQDWDSLVFYYHR
ncbi:nb-arc and tpr domain-containing protein [Viridothelium virens]|uniref:Nb-arc and tpr domain-containing protein n=1 Tax=Viridothelium virens TaxID=1048519 RepID=A0A6A6HKM3_VIRVR|nr:nb-arc and tpr domain-containing protein [Viridothelium virens]